MFASPSDSATVRWYHRGTLIDDVNDNRYTASSEGDIHRLRVSSVSETETGEYTIVVSLNGVNSTDSISLNFPGLYNRYSLIPLINFADLCRITLCHCYSIINLGE